MRSCRVRRGWFGEEERGRHRRDAGLLHVTNTSLLAGGRFGRSPLFVRRGLAERASGRRPDCGRAGSHRAPPGYVESKPRRRPLLTLRLSPLVPECFRQSPRPVCDKSGRRRLSGLHGPLVQVSDRLRCGRPGSRRALPGRAGWVEVPRSRLPLQSRRWVEA
jgi:hypothetical protein